MFGKSSKWWFGKNSLFGQAIGQTKWGVSAQNDGLDISHSLSEKDKEQILFVALGLGLVILLK